MENKQNDKAVWIGFFFVELTLFLIGAISSGAIDVQ